MNDDRKFDDLPYFSPRQQEYYDLKPLLGDLVHYVEESRRICRAAEVIAFHDETAPVLLVKSPDLGPVITGYQQGDPEAKGVSQHEAVAPGEWVQREEDRVYKIGTWHWPCDRVKPKP